MRLRDHFNLQRAELVEFISLAQLAHSEDRNSREALRVVYTNKLTEENIVPARLIPVLWVGRAAILLGGGYYIVHIMH